MPTPTYRLISSTTLDATNSTVTFSNIPQTYNDLYLVLAVRDSASQNWGAGSRVWLNSYVGSGNWRYSVDSNGTSVNYTTENNIGWFRVGQPPAATATAAVYSNDWLYLPGYTLNYQKPMYSKGAAASGTLTEGYLISGGGYSNIAVPVTSLSVQSNSGAFVAGSTFSLYGIKNS